MDILSSVPENGKKSWQLTEETKRKKKHLVGLYRKLKQKTGWSNVEMAKVIGDIHPSSLSNYFNNHYTPHLFVNGRDMTKRLKEVLAAFDDNTVEKEEKIPVVEKKDILKKADAIAKISTLDVDDETKEKLLSVLF